MYFSVVCSMCRGVLRCGGMCCVVLCCAVLCDSQCGAVAAVHLALGCTQKNKHCIPHIGIRRLATAALIECHFLQFDAEAEQLAPPAFRRNHISNMFLSTKQLAVLFTKFALPHGTLRKAFRQHMCDEWFIQYRPIQCRTSSDMILFFKDAFCICQQCIV